MLATDNFDENFLALCGHKPFPWQRALYLELCRGHIPSSCDIPTGLGKTAVIALWLLALANHASREIVTDFPRRLIFVVNRRTVVDQSTLEAIRLRQRIASLDELFAIREALRSLATLPSDAPLAISTLRGEFADNAEWRVDPARPAVIIGTVDMIGSRLLFSGYGRSFRSRPLEAALLGCDSLLVHDESHLEPAFQKLVDSIACEQQRSQDLRPLRVLSMTATSRLDGRGFVLTDDDYLDERVRTRVEARKGLQIHKISPKEGGNLCDEVVRNALAYRDGNHAVLVFLQRVDDAESVSKQLKKKVGPDRVEVLTGTLRGLERDTMTRQSPVFARFLPPGERQGSLVPACGTVYLVCTSAGEVGVNLSADHMVCDLTPFERMVQRLGRVNRFGGGDALIDVVVEREIEDTEEKASPYDVSLKQTLNLLSRLPLREDGRHDASPKSLRELPAQDCLSAFSPPPYVLPINDALLDAWSLTSIRGRLPARPEVAEYLHGLSGFEPPDTFVAWREEVSLLAGSSIGPDEILDEYPLKPHELLRDRTSRVVKHLRIIAKRHPDEPVWVVTNRDDGHSIKLSELSTWSEESLQYVTVVLPPKVGGLRDGLLDGSAEYDVSHAERYDVADEWLDEHGRPRRRRTWDDEEPPEGMRLIRTHDLRPEADETDEEGESYRRYRHWFAMPRSADVDGLPTSAAPQPLDSHQRSAEDSAAAMVHRLGLKGPEAQAVILASRWHDLGKNRRVWQRSIGNTRYPTDVFAKSGGRMVVWLLSHYRHELGSLLDVVNEPDFGQLSPEVADLVLHIIAAHHGRARPHFPPEESLDTERPEDQAARFVREVPSRFGRLQQRYGRWGLAWLESLMKAADRLVS